MRAAGGEGDGDEMSAMDCAPAGALAPCELLQMAPPEDDLTQEHATAPQPVSSRPALPRPASWVRAATDAEAFAREQAALGHLWTFLGLASDVAEDGEWFRTALGGRSIFVQRFGSEVRGFENRCAHRLYPLRTEDRGKGPVVCGFHHWRYNKDGLALGVPVCEDAFCTTPRDLDARLKPVEVEVLGGLVFGRFPSPDHPETLAEFLNDTAPILEMWCPAGMKARRMTQDIPAYWKFLTHIALDEYHLVAVHPSTFGKAGYLKAADVKYARVGRHSVYILRAGETGIAQTIAGCRNRSYRPHSYHIVNLFPGFAVSNFHTVYLFGRSWFFQLAFRYVPLAPDRSRLEAWVTPAPMDPPRPGIMGLIDRMVLAVASRIVPYQARRVLNEDNAVCVTLQSMAAQMDAEQRISPTFETRIGWFEEEYAKAMGTATGTATGAAPDAQAPTPQPVTPQPTTAQPPT